MRLRRIELIAIALTLAFACFTGGYFAGRRGAVNIITVEPQYGGTLGLVAGETTNSGNRPALSVAASESTGSAETGVSRQDTEAQPPGGSAPAGSKETVGAPRGGDGKININSASQAELTDLPGIGNVIAGRIVDYRTQNGAFSKIDDLTNISGIGEKRFEAIKDRITVG